jgi:hypothetical protein
MKLFPKLRESKEDRAIRLDGEAQLRQLPKLTDENIRKYAELGSRCKKSQAGGRHLWMELGVEYQCQYCGKWNPEYRTV